MCDLILSAHLIPIIPTFVHLLMISLDRYFKLVYPMKYIKYMTISKAKLIVVFMWLTGFLTTAVFLFIPGHEYENNCLVIKINSKDTNGYHLWFFFLFFKYIPFTFLMFCNFRIYKIATNLKKAVEQQLTVHDSDHHVQLRYHSGKLIVEKHNEVDNSNESKKSSGDDTFVVCHKEEPTLIKTRKLTEWTRTAIRQRKIAILISVIVIAAAVCWFPASTAYMMTWFCQDCRVKGTWIELLHPWLLYINSAINPIILLLMSEDFRKAYRLIYSQAFQCLCHCTSLSEVHSDLITKNPVVSQKLL